ncbi:hypothetical protein RvY_16862 [Ramazzottius varieornatus]|uniref:Uncharacterized protein n=1 Tax=Ramazzottius varieornatus TaxID=947166 RepID=A0A1D1W113_RAMVA|nr:hypothetical protein RvY_16862 [Ramazzottius varieornatus]
MDLLDQDFLQPKKLVEIRWVALEQAAIRAIIRDYNGLVLDICEAMFLAAEERRLAGFRLLHDTLEEFVKVLDSWEHNESITTLKDKIKFQHGLVFFQERPETVDTPVNGKKQLIVPITLSVGKAFPPLFFTEDYNGNSFTAFRKESVVLLQNVLLFFNLRFPETEATRHFRVFQWNKIPRESGRYGDTYIQVLA